MNTAINNMVNEIVSIIGNLKPSIYLYGSVVLDDFKLGWSDVDLLVLTQKRISEAQAKELVGLRQAMLAKEPRNPYYRCFEGGMLTLDAFISGKKDTVVYWGTSGERITDTYRFDSFGMTELLERGLLLYGGDVRNELTLPTFSMLYADVRHHCETIRKYAQKPDRSLYSFGWMLDIARCIYTLRTGRILAKTDSGVWALENRLCPDPDVLEFALQIRKDPMCHKQKQEMLDYAQTLGAPVQRFADVLQTELTRAAAME